MFLIALINKHLPQDDENMIGAVAYPGRMSEAEDQIAGCCGAVETCPTASLITLNIQRAADRRPVRQITASRGALISVISSIGLLVVASA